ncbi:MAG: DUF4430 domain-containing protein [Provencibacterium sp.]|jgi:hypothetical protein|nr:DUF4430 domain-containing protein [Provencibacterium sp.]
MTQKSKRILGAAILALAVIILGTVYYFQRPAGQAGEKTIYVQVTANEEQEKFTLQTAEEFLGAALLENGLIEGENGPYGLFITTVNGITADEAQNQWWCITRGGEQLSTGADSTPIADGEQYELTLSVY